MSNTAFQSTLLMRGATWLSSVSLFADWKFQSTLLMRGATMRLAGDMPDGEQFQSTLLMRGATTFAMVGAMVMDFNPRSSCEERPPGTARATVRGKISIHAPHARSDCTLPRCRRASRYFNPRSSCEERLHQRGTYYDSFQISIHAPHARSDEIPCVFFPRTNYFNPRSSCEERLELPRGQETGAPFQSTLLMRGAT